MYSLTPTFKDVGKTDGNYIKFGWSHFKFNIMNWIFHFPIFKNVSMNWEKYVFHLEKWYSAHNADFSTLLKVLLA